MFTIARVINFMTDTVVSICSLIPFYFFEQS
uniref:Uncharacterized protein n=1 Tax=Rhizophora mucronata TaxID=61149 RepID=A0A2P2QXT6_RHIMU